MAHALQTDTLAFAKKLRAAGADEKLADAIVEGITAADTSELATKADLAGVEAKLGGEINGIKQEIQMIHSELKWIKIIGAAIAASTVLPMMADGAAKILEFYK